MPAWVGTDGFPLSWRHYQYGVPYLSRSRMKNMLDAATAARAAQAGGPDYKRWRNDVQQVIS